MEYFKSFTFLLHLDICQANRSHHVRKRKNYGVKMVNSLLMVLKLIEEKR